jgi:uncharacterized membrane protein (DUF2068 family)
MKRPSAFIAITIYKGFMAILLAITAMGIFFSWRNYDQLQDFSESLSLAGKEGMIAWIVERVISFQPGTLKFAAIAAAIYALVTAIEAIGLWYQRQWAEWLIIFSVAISIPPEIYELVQKVSLIKLAVFILNLVILAYLGRNLGEKLKHLEE